MAWNTSETPLSDVAPLDVARWRDLSSRAVAANGWLDARFLSPAGRWDAAAGLQVISVESEGRWGAVLVGAAHRPMRRVPIAPWTTAAPFMQIHADRHVPLLDASTAEAAGGALMSAVLARHGLVRLHGIPRGTAHAALEAGAVTAGARWRVDRAYEATVAFADRDLGQLTDAGGLALPLDHLDSGRRNKIVRRARQLAREAGGPLTVRAVDVSTAAAFDAFVRFQASGWKGDPARGGGALALDDEHRTWIETSVLEFARDGDLLAWQLVAGDRVLYQSLNVRSAGGCFLILDAYAEEFASRGPGTVGRIATWHHALLTPGVRWYDPGLDPRNAEASAVFPHAMALVDVTCTRGRRAALKDAVLRRAHQWKTRGQADAAPR